MPIEPSGRAHPERLAVRVPDHVVYRDFAEQTVALNLHTGRYHGLNETSAEMLEPCARPRPSRPLPSSSRRRGTSIPACCSPTCSSCARASRAGA